MIFYVPKRRSSERISSYVWHTKKTINNAIACIARKNKKMVHSMIRKNRIYYVVGISIFGFNKYWQTVFNLIELNMSPNFKQLLQTRLVSAEKIKSYLQQYDVKNESLPQTVNDETENIREHTCKAKWDGLQSMNTLWSKFFHHGRSKITQHKQSTGKIESESTEAVPVRLHQELTGSKL